MTGFDFSGVDHPQNDGLTGLFEKISDAIDRLAARRKKAITVEALARSRIAWQVATYQQAILYRVVALGVGTRDAWNARNVLVTFLTTRALVETIAVFDDFVRSLLAHVASEDLGAIDWLALNRISATKDNKALLDHYPEMAATNVLTLIDKLAKRYDFPIRTVYDGMSERCHPNSAGHHGMFSETDLRRRIVTFSESNPGELTSVGAPLGVLLLFEYSMDELDPAVLKIAEIEHRLRPWLSG